MIGLFVRLLGTVACFFSSWILGVFAILPIAMVGGYEGYRKAIWTLNEQKGIFKKSAMLHLTGNLLSLAVAIYGIYCFPYFDSVVTATAAVVAGLMVFAETVVYCQKNV